MARKDSRSDKPNGSYKAVRTFVRILDRILIASNIITDC